MFDIDREITDAFELDVKSAVPFRDFYIANTSSGKKIIKKTRLSAERIQFVHEAKEHLFKSGFQTIDRFLCTKEGYPYALSSGNCYTVSDIIEGKECNFDDKKDVIRASAALALLHKASAGYVPGVKATLQSDLGNMPGYFRKRLGEIKKLRKTADRRKSKFDYMYLDHVGYFCEIGERVLEELNRSSYQKLVEKCMQERSFCHHDFTHHNIILGDNKTSIVNFEFCCYELKIYDIANLLRRKMRKCNWDVSEARTILREYQKYGEITNEEFYVMKLMLQFPQKLWRVANRFYNSKRSWSEKGYIARLEEVIDEIKPLERFIERYDTLI